MQSHGFLEMIPPRWPQNRHKLQGNPFLDVIIVSSLKANIEETAFSNINPLGIQTLLNFSQITTGLNQKTGPFIPHSRRNVSRTLRLHNVLENLNIGPTDSLSCFRLQDKLFSKLLSKVSTIYPNIWSLLISQEVKELLQKGAIQKTPFTRDGFYSHPFLLPKKGGSMRPVIDLSSLNKFMVNEHFQIENLSCLKTLLIDKYRLKRCLPFCFCSRVFLKVSSLHLEGHMLPVESLTIRTMSSPQDFYESFKTCCF